MFESATTLESAPNCIIMIDGSPLDDLDNSFVSVEVNIHRNRPAMGRVTFSTTRSEDDSWDVVDADVLRPWKTLDISFDLDGEEINVFSGYIIKIETSFSGDNSQVVVIGQDKTVLLDREHKTRVWGSQDEPVTDGDILNEIMAAYGFSVEAEDGRSHSQLNQDETDVRFINRIARANGFEFSFSEDTFYFGPPRLDGEGQNPILILMGEDTNCSDFSLVDDGYRPDSIQVDVYHDRDYERHVLTPEQTRLGNENCEDASTALGVFCWKLKMHGMPAEAALVEAQARTEEHALKIRAAGSLDGVAYGGMLLSGKPVPVEGIGLVHSGTYYVDEVTHRISTDGYQQNFVLLRNARGML